MRGTLASVMLSTCLAACGGGSATPSEPPASTAPTPEAAPAKAATSQRALLLGQAWFKKELSGAPKPQPAKLVVAREVNGQWTTEELLDPESNVFHKAMPWRGGILTIGAMKAKLVHWTKVDGAWTPQLLWEKSWGGKFDRLRDVETGDVTGDGKENLVIATHDQGVVAVGTEVDGAWTFAELDQTADRFVHEIELGDVDGDGKKELYATPSDRNRASGESQPGGVVRYDYIDGAFVRSEVIHWDDSHAKEILVADLTGDGRDELYAVKEAHTRKDPSGEIEVIEPVRIERLDRGADGKWTSTLIAHIDDRQCRFLVPGDVDGDGKKDLIAASWKKGLFLLRQGADGSFSTELIDAQSGGFEHAAHLADLDGDGHPELYVADDAHSAVNRYRWTDGAFQKEAILATPALHITWNIQDMAVGGE